MNNKTPLNATMEDNSERSASMSGSSVSGRRCGSSQQSIRSLSNQNRSSHSGQDDNVNQSNEDPPAEFRNKGHQEEQEEENKNMKKGE